MSRVDTPENSSAAIQRLLSTQHETPGVTIEQLAINEIAARVNDESALITFDDDNHQFTISDFDGLVQRVTGVGDDFAGGYNRVGDFGFARSVILAGHGTQLSTAIVREPATGKWEIQPTGPLSQYFYDNLVLRGWHLHSDNHPARTLKLVIGIWAAIMIGGSLLVAGILSIGLLAS